MSIKIREAVVTDLDGLLETLGNLADCNQHVGRARFIKCLSERAGAGVRTFVALDGGEVVGTASLFVEPKFIHGCSYTAHIEDVATHREHQGRGISSKLIKHLLAVAEDEGCYKVVLDCSTDNIDFYRRLGFLPWDMGMRFHIKAT